MQEVIKTRSFLDSLNEIIKKNDYCKIFFFTGSIGHKILKASDYDKNSNYFNLLNETKINKYADKIEKEIEVVPSSFP